MKKKLFLLLLVLGIAAFLTWDYIQTKNVTLTEAEKEQAVKGILGHPLATPSAAPLGEQTYQDKYYSISYPKAASVYQRPKENTPGPTELSYFAFQELSPKLFFTILVRKSDISDIKEDSGVSFRLKNSEYKESEITQDSTPGLVFSKDGDVKEKVAFFLKNGRVYSFSVQSSDQEELDKLFSSVLSSLKLSS